MPPHIDCDKVHVGACLIIRPGESLFTITDDAWLMIHRTGEHGFNRWSVPGGWMDRGETPEEACLRELEEELGPDIKVTAPKIVAHTNDLVEKEKNHLWHSYTIWLESIFISGTPRNMEPEKVDQIKWIIPKTLKEEEMFGPLATLLDK